MTNRKAPLLMRDSWRNRFKQAGYATLGIGLVLLSMLSLMTIYLSKSGILDLRSSADKARYAEALSMAERRLDIGIGWLSNDTNRATLDVANDTSWPTCNTLAAPLSALGSTWRCRTFTVAVGAATETFTLATPNDASRGRVFYGVATGTSADGSASAVVKQGARLIQLFTPGEVFPPPMVGTGNVPLNGTFSVVANPNAGGPGVPVSVWSAISISAPSGSSATCQLYEFNKDGDCSGAPISNAAKGKGPDIVDNDPNFPTDLLQFTFGVPTANYTSLKNQATLVGNCNGLAGLTGIVWVDGDCTINGVVGSETNPLIVVVESGDVQMNANSRFYGLLFAFGPNGDAGDITANGGAKFYGSILSNDTATMGININGTFDMIWNGNVVGAFTDPGNEEFTIMAIIPGSWADYL